MSVEETPRTLGFRMPAEWEPHEATWLVWPHNHNDWPGKLVSVQWVYTEIIRHLHPRERVRVVVEDPRRQQGACRMLDQAGVDLTRVGFHRFVTDRSWVRDSGPLFIRNDFELAATCWRFNGWARYPNWKKDAALARRMARALKVCHWEPHDRGRRVVLEGGSVDVNGFGTLLATEECLLDEEQQRNPGMSRERLEIIFATYLGIRKVIWLARGIAGDDTHGHVDDLARFVSPRRVVTVVEHNRGDINYEPLQENLRRLRSASDQDGRPLEVVELPMPRPLYFQRYRLPASYANFYVANGLVLVPTFNDPNDRTALNTLAAVFPDREVIGIHSVELAWGFGTLHCSTQQEPSLAQATKRAGEQDERTAKEGTPTHARRRRAKSSSQELRRQTAK